MLKRILCTIVVFGLLAASSAIVGCGDEVKVRHESTTTTVQQEEVVVP